MATDSETETLDKPTMPPISWWAPRSAAVALVLLLSFLTDFGNTTLSALVSQLAGLAGSVCLLLGAWRSIIVREELSRLSLISTDDALIANRTAEFFRKKNKKMLEMLHKEWRWYINGVGLLVASFGISGGGALRKLLIG